jgi:hypothetical protein
MADLKSTQELAAVAVRHIYSTQNLYLVDAGYESVKILFYQTSMSLDNWAGCLPIKLTTNRTMPKSFHHIYLS